MSNETMKDGERAECIKWANANGFPKYHDSMVAAWEERARRAAPQATVKGDERAAFPRYTEWQHLCTHGEWSNGVPAWARDHDGRMNDSIAARAVIEELAARAGVPQTMERAGLFVRHSMFGPWIEISEREEGSELLYRLVGETAPKATMTPQSTEDAIDATFRRNLDLKIVNLTVSAENDITWIAMTCRGKVSSLTAARNGAGDAV